MPGNVEKPDRAASPAPDLDRWSLVVAGTWNLAIFSPAWVRTHVLPNLKEADFEIAITRDGTQLRRFRTAELRMTVFSSKVELHPLAETPEVLAALEVAAVKLLERLRDTPVTAFGVNFGFDADDALLGEALSSRYDDPIAALGYGVETRVMRRQLRLKAGLVNLTFSRDGSLPVRIDLNHHFVVRDVEDTISQITGSVDRAMNSTTSILTACSLAMEAS